MNRELPETLLHLFDQISADPETVPLVPVESWPEGSQEWRMLASFRSMLGILQQSKQDALGREERCAQVLQQANVGLWDWDLRTDHVYYSPSWKRMLGYAEDEITSHLEEWHKRIHPDDLQRALTTLQAHLDGPPATCVCEHRLRHKDGSYRWVLARGISLCDATGKPYRMIGSHADITDYKHVEEQLREREEQYRSIFEATSDGMVIRTLDGVAVEANLAACRMHGYDYEEFLGLPRIAIVHPDSYPAAAAFWQAIQARGNFSSRAVDLRKDGTPFPVEVHGTTFTYKGQPHTLSVIRDITEQVQAYQLLEQRVEERTHELSTLLEVSHTVASTLELRPLLGLILDQLKAVINYSGAFISIITDGEAAIVDYRGERPRELLLGHRFSLNQADQIMVILQRREPIIIGDTQEDTPLAQAWRRIVGAMPTPNYRYQPASSMAVPLMPKEQVIGILALSAEEPSYFTPHHAALALAFANQAAIALENAQLYEQAHEWAALEERQRLARELHDSVSQALYGIALGTHTARTLLDRDPHEVAEPLNYVLSLAEAAQVEMRALIFELRPESLEREGLVGALAQQAAAVQARHHLAVTTTFCEEPALPLKTKQELYRIAQEALQNTVKHAHANSVELRLSETEAALLLDVCDDGLGFDPSSSFPGHLGLQSMRERVSGLGGTLQIQSAPAAGTCIFARIPCHG